MVNLVCQSNGGCPFQYYCDLNNNCLHDQVFPLNLYTILIYCLFPFASALCNVTGNSFGQYKVVLLMDFLNYTESAATTISYPLIVGTAIFNFILFIFKRHPIKNTSAVDYNIIMIIIPNVLYGSTIGALVNYIIPPIVADSIIIVIMGLFSVKFFLRFYNFYKQGKLQQNNVEAQKQLQVKSISARSDYQESFTNKKQLLIKENQFKQQLRVGSITKQIKWKNKNLTNQMEVINDNPYKLQLQKHLKYQSSFHFPHIAGTIIIFVIFEVLSFLAQGKIIFFSICTEFYVIGICVLTVIYAIFIVGMFTYTKKRLNYYRRIQYFYQYKIDSLKFYSVICVGSFLGGFNGGVFGLGSSTTIIFALLFLDIQPVVVTATVGFQVVFSGLGSLCEAFATDSISLEVAGLFFGITFVIGGAFSFLANKIVSKFNLNKVNQTLMLIVGFLTGSSTIGMIINIVLSYASFGSSFMISSNFEC